MFLCVGVAGYAGNVVASSTSPFFFSSCLKQPCPDGTTPNGGGCACLAGMCFSPLMSPRESVSACCVCAGLLRCRGVILMILGYLARRVFWLCHSYDTSPRLLGQRVVSSISFTLLSPKLSTGPRMFGVAVFLLSLVWLFFLQMVLL